MKNVVLGILTLLILLTLVVFVPGRRPDKDTARAVNAEEAFRMCRDQLTAERQLWEADKKMRVAASALRVPFLVPHD